MANPQTTLTKKAHATTEDAHRAAHTKTVANFKHSVESCETALAERVKAGEKEIAFFKKELAAAEKRLVDFEASVVAEAE